MEKINIAEILKDCPKGMELDCVMYDNNVQLDTIQDGNAFPIKINTPEGRISLSKYGCYSLNPHCKCIIYPKGKTTWEGFQRPFKDGDVVTYKLRGSLVAFIYKDRINTMLVKSHFALYARDMGFCIDGDIALKEEEIVFATEEEKQKLFKAIKDNGYKWNPETKTLEMLIVPKFKVGDRVKKNKDYISGIVTDIFDDSFKVTYDGGGCSYVQFHSQCDWELVPNKFDITTLKPFDKVLVRGNVGQKWIIDFFGFMDKEYPFVCVEHHVSQCIPYEGNEHLLDTTDDCDEYYKTW